MAVNITNPKASGDFQGTAIPVEDVVANDTGTIAKAFMTAGFYNAGSTNVIVNGETLQPGVSKTYPFVDMSYKDAISFDATGGTLNISVIY